jgi:hypothetical protein
MGSQGFLALGTLHCFVLSCDGFAVILVVVKMVVLAPDLLDVAVAGFVIVFFFGCFDVKIVDVLCE